MDDAELTALRSFLDELNADDILDDSASSAIAALKANLESSVAAFTSDDCSSSASSVASVSSDTMSEVSVSDDDMKSKQLSMKKTKRERQRDYDQRSKAKKQAWKSSVTRALVVGLKLLNALLEDRIERTRRVVITLRLAHRRKDNGKAQEDESARRGAEQEAKTQLSLNNAAILYIDQWTTSWALTRLGSSKFFLREFAAEIEASIDGLSAHRGKLTESTTELEWCMLQRPNGVWV